MLGFSKRELSKRRNRTEKKHENEEMFDHTCLCTKNAPELKMLREPTLKAHILSYFNLLINAVVENPSTSGTATTIPLFSRIMSEPTMYFFDVGSVS